MSKVFKLNLRGLNEVMKSAGMQSVLNSAAAQLARQSGGDGSAGVEYAHPISFVAIASVRTDTFKARLDNSRHNSLLKAAGSVRL